MSCPVRHEDLDSASRKRADHSDKLLEEVYEKILVKDHREVQRSNAASLFFYPKCTLYTFYTYFGHTCLLTYPEDVLF